MLTPEQCRAARALLDWTQQDLSARANISDFTIRNFERRQSDIRKSTAQLLRLLFESEGVEFIDPNGGGPGARLKENP